MAVTSSRASRRCRFSRRARAFLCWLSAMLLLQTLETSPERHEGGSSGSEQARLAARRLELPAPSAERRGCRPSLSARRSISLLQQDQRQGSRRKSSRPNRHRRSRRGARPCSCPLLLAARRRTPSHSSSLFQTIPSHLITSPPRPQRRKEKRLKLTKGPFPRN
ncbi:hypothetical protein BCR35DRAFT_113552 [Leucosporidium creatinivorum]|uniref:Uncharacterized protein n=1 Tax=Leucosporidium creatinivorum TaxID=106004 RepID=A0A1Y2F168_9BASI|nr:hypothetical protein BCR35DRAFT_113552 [Leucosporidium creatinivorum]